MKFHVKLLAEVLTFITKKILNAIADAFRLGHADAALAASVFHFGEIKIPELKQYLHNEGICVRL